MCDRSRSSEEAPAKKIQKTMDKMELGKHMELYLLNATESPGIYPNICQTGCGVQSSQRSEQTPAEEPNAVGQPAEEAPAGPELEELFPLSKEELEAELRKKGRKAGTAKQEKTDKAADKKKDGKGSKKGKPAEDRMTKISKAMTQVLRHDAVKQKVGIRADGYVLCSELAGLNSFKKLDATLEDMEEVVASSDKQRFQIAVQRNSSQAYWVRAVQGHSMDVINHDLILQKLEVNTEGLPDELVHGTYLRHWDSIKELGLLAGGKGGQKFRCHVHFATGLPEDGGVISGMRQSCDLALYVDLKKALAEGLPVFRSNNNVYLTPGMNSKGSVPTRFINRAVRLKDKVEIWPAGGE